MLYLATFKCCKNAMQFLASLMVRSGKLGSGQHSFACPKMTQRNTTQGPRVIIIVNKALINTHRSRLVKLGSKPVCVNKAIEW